MKFQILFAQNFLQENFRKLPQGNVLIVLFLVKVQVDIFQIMLILE